MASKEIEKIKNHVQTLNQFSILRCIWWLNQNLVLQPVNPLNALKTRQFSAVTRCGAVKAKKTATSQNAHTPCVLNAACSQAESAVKPLNAKHLTAT
jgi:hypothetical protein